MTKVIFRKLEAEILAVFPQIAASHDGYQPLSYAHTGQHSACSPLIASFTKPARPEEYADLLSELKGIGYNDLVVAQRMTYKDLQARLKDAQS